MTLTEPVDISGNITHSLLSQWRSKERNRECQEALAGKKQAEDNQQICFHVVKAVDVDDTLVSRVNSTTVSAQSCISKESKGAWLRCWSLAVSVSSHSRSPNVSWPVRLSSVIIHTLLLSTL